MCHSEFRRATLEFPHVLLTLGASRRALAPAELLGRTQLQVAPFKTCEQAYVITETLMHLSSPERTWILHECSRYPHDGTHPGSKENESDWNRFTAMARASSPRLGLLRCGSPYIL